MAKPLHNMNKDPNLASPRSPTSVRREEIEIRQHHHHSLTGKDSKGESILHARGLGTVPISDQGPLTTLTSSIHSRDMQWPLDSAVTAVMRLQVRVGETPEVLAAISLLGM